jgi:photosystem II stability/assembly factor-like uncharacterized protein
MIKRRKLQWSMFCFSILLTAQVLGQAPAPVDESYLGLLKWRSIGPSRGGRVVAVAGDPVNKRVFYQGTTGGGVWKTDDGGLNWRNVSDGYFQTGSVGAVAVAPSDPNVVYVGMGEACIRGNASHGDGVYKTTDAGESWTRVGLEETRHIARVVVHPTDPDTVYVAALGDAWGPSPHRGVFLSKDGGRSWSKVLFRSEDAGAIDLVMDPGNPKVLYASLLELRRFPWGFRSAGPGTGLFKTTDGGESWTEISNNTGLPSGLKGRIGLALSPARPERIWAIIDAEIGKKGVFRTDDSGATWRRVSDKADLTQRPWYYHHIFADPKDPDVVYVLNTSMWKSTDGGETYDRVRTPHGDNHDLWIDPQDPLRMVEGNDGGATVSFNGGKSWSTILNQPTAQLYHVITDNQVPYRVYAAQQDNTTISLPSRSEFGRITIEDWYTVGGGEAGYIAPNSEDPNIVYAADHHWLYRYDHRTKQIRDISPNPETHYGWGSADINYRFWWTYPVVLSPHDSHVLYVTSQFVHRTTNEGQSWEIISPDLSRADPETMEKTPSYLNPVTGSSWGPITREAYGPEWYGTIFSFAESPAKAGVLWAGSDDGYVHVSKDGGENWTNVTPPDLPEFALVSIIDPSPHDAGAAYVAATRYKLQDHRPYLYKTADFGQTWTKITGGIPENDFTRVIREDPERKGLLYAGTETGAYVSLDDGAHWQSLRLNLPVVPVHDLVVKKGDLVAATHGRSFWILDNVALLHQLDSQALSEAVHLFRPRTTIRFRQRGQAAGQISGMSSDYDGKNPPLGVVVPYHFKEKPSGEVTLEFLDGNSKLIQTFSSETSAPEPDRGFFGGPGGSRKVEVEVGPNRFVWDMRYPGADVLPDAVFQGRADGPLAPPGDYQVRLTVNGDTYSQPFQIVRDPRINYSDADLVEQFEFLIGVRDKLTETMNVVRKIRKMRQEAEKRVEEAGGGESAKALLEALNDKLYPLEERLVQYRARAGQDLINYPTAIDSKLARLLNFASMADAPPTEGEKELFQRLSDGVAERAKALELVEQNEYAEVMRLNGSDR